MGKDLKGKELGTGLSQRPDGRYMARYKGKCVYSKNLKEIRKAYTDLVESVDSGTLRAGSQTLDAYFNASVDDQEAKYHIKPSTAREKRLAYNKHIAPVLGKVKIADLTRADFRKLQSDLSRELSYNTVNRVISSVAVALSQAVEDELLMSNPAKIRFLRDPGNVKMSETVHRALTREETALLLDALSDHNLYYNVTDFLLSTGMRFGEMAALKWSDIGFKERVIHVTKTTTVDRDGNTIVNTPKTVSSVRTIPVNNRILDVLKRQRKIAEIIEPLSIDALVFPPVRAKYLSEQSYWLGLRSAAKRSGIEDIAPHCLRATFATRAIESGMNPKTLQAILGHSTISMTMDLYAHVMESTKAEEMALLDAKSV